MGKALYRKYRSKSLDEVVGQEHITRTLKNALKSGMISHAYLFTGPRGVGKTSVARIMAHEVNKLPYGDNTEHLDIIEIDAASNRRIDEIRDLREKVHIAPTSSKYKVYIIDEVHMLTKEAFNALLKTLEEPPAHVIFILATTEAHKLPETIISRTQRFAFKPVSKNEVVPHLRMIAEHEKIDVDDEALALIAEHGEGSFRDSISLLDQASAAGGKIDEARVRGTLGMAPAEAIDDIIRTLHSGNAGDLLKTLSGLFEHGFGAAQIAKQLSQQLRLQLTENDSPLSSGVLLQLLRELIDVPASQDPARLLELTLIKPLLDTTTPISNPTPAPTKINEQKPPEAVKNIPEPVESAKHPKQATAAPPRQAPKQANNFSTDIWEQTMDMVKARHNTLYSILRMATPEYSNNTLTLYFEFPFHQKRISEHKNRQLISEILLQLTAENIAIECVLTDKKPASKVSEPKKDNHAGIETISNIFGTAEVLES